MRFVFEHGSRRNEHPRPPLAARRGLFSLPLTADLFYFFVVCVLCFFVVCDASSAAAATAFLRRSRTPQQCLYLDEGVAPQEACGGAAPHVRLRFCDAYSLGRLLSEGAPCNASFLARLRELDEMARRVACRFGHLLRRFDCDTENSVSWTCSDCEAAYKQWVCAMFLLPVQVPGAEGGLKPCRYVCRLVEQRCPYFHPSVKEQYAGERVFKCIDPDIPDLESMEAASAYGSAGRCYCPHHLLDGGVDSEAECRLLTPSQLRRNASRRGAARPLAPPHLLLMLLLLLLLATTR